MFWGTLAEGGGVRADKQEIKLGEASEVRP